MTIFGSNIAVEYVNIIRNNDLLESTSDDPQIIIKLVEPIKRGWHHLAVEIQGQEVRNPKLYLDLGEGFCEKNSALLAERNHRGLYSALIFVPVETHLIRLDPSDIKGELRVISFTLKLQSLLAFCARVTTNAMNESDSAVKSLAQLPSKYMAYYRTSSFRTLLSDSKRFTGRDYKRWISKYDFDPTRDAVDLQKRIEGLEQKPLISILMPTYNTPAKLLNEAIKSVRRQIYSNWELCIADDFSSQKHVVKLLRNWQRRDSRIKVVFREKNGHISQATNSAFELAHGEWVALLDHDDLLRENSLAEVVIELNRFPDAQLIYSDEDKLDSKGLRYDPYFKPNFSRELLRSQNYLNHLTVHRANNIRKVGGWRPGFEGSQDYDLNLRIIELIDRSTIRHIPKVLYHWRAADGSTATSGSEKSYAWKAGFNALVEHVQRLGMNASVENAPDSPFYRIRNNIPEPAPLVSLIIPTRDQVQLLKGCVGTIIEKTTYPNYEILIVDNGSKDTATLDYLDEIAKYSNIRVLAYDRPFNYSAINNFAVKHARGSLLGFINNDIEVISADWLTEMVSWAAQVDVGCVGAKLYYSNDTIQHAGVILGLGGVAGHSHKYFPRDHSGYFSRLKLVQNLSAVTAACLLVSKIKFEAVHGFDEDNLSVAFNDVDLCLKIQQIGYNNVWTPYAELYHLESISRGPEDSPEKLSRFQKEISFISDKWEIEKITDPYYSVHLTKDHEDFSLRI